MIVKILIDLGFLYEVEKTVIGLTYVLFKCRMHAIFQSLMSTVYSFNLYSSILISALNLI